MKLLNNKLQLVIAFLLGLIVMLAFMMGRMSASARDKKPEEEHVVTAEEEYLLQLEFAQKREQLTGTHEAASQEDPTVWESKIKHLLPYVDQHPSFDRTPPMDYDYTVGGNELDEIINYAINATKDLPHPNGGKMGLDLVKTWSLENSRFSVIQQGTADERGICQLRYKYHKTFMDSQEFFDPYSQVDYCVSVYLDWYNRKRGSQSLSNVRSTWPNRATASSRFIKL